MKILLLSRYGLCSIPYSVVLVTALSILMLFSMFFRISNGIIARDLVSEFGFSAVTLGILTGSFFYSFALLQIPLGLLLDRFGPRPVLTVFALIGAFGSLLFAVGTTYTTLLVGRILMGIGMSAALMGSLMTFALKFRPDKFARLSGIVIAVGTGGSLLAASPLALMSSFMGWRNVFLLAALATTLLAFAIFWVLGKSGDTITRPHIPEASLRLRQRLRLVLGSLSFWQIAMAALFRYGTFVALQGLWLGLYLMDVYGFSPVQAGNVLAFLAVGMGIGSLVAGQLSDKTFRSRKGVALWGFIFYSLSLFCLVGLFPFRSMLWFCAIAFSFGFFSGFGNLTYAHAKEIFPPAISGTVMTWVNFFVMAGGAVLTSALGKIIDLFPHTARSYPPGAYHLAFTVCFIAMAASTVFYAFSKEERRE